MNIGWKVGDKEVGTNTDNYCCCTFKYEYPSPTAIAANAMHIGDSAGKQTSKHVGCYNGTPEYCKASLGFFACIPEANQVEAYAFQSVIIPTSRAVLCEQTKGSVAHFQILNPTFDVCGKRTTYCRGTLLSQQDLERTLSQEVRYSSARILDKA